MVPATNRQPAIAHAALAVLIITVAGISVWLGWRTQHYPFLNDFWPLFFQAGTLDLSNPASLRNGFFPPGYGLFLVLAGGTRVLAHAYYANLLFAIGTLLVTFVWTARLATPGAAVTAVALTAFFPITFSLTMTTGPDMGCVFMLWSGFALLHAAVSAGEPRWRTRCGWAAAVLFVVAILWRYHALVFAVAALAAVCVTSRGRIVWRAAAGVGAALAILAGLSLLPGFSDQLARAQAFGAWEALHPVNWYRMPTDVPPSVAAVIRAEPYAFLQAYWTFHQPYLWLLAPPAIAAIVLRGGGGLSPSPC